MIVTIYTKPNCSYCTFSKNLLNSHQIPFEEIELIVGQPIMEGKKMMSLGDFKKTMPRATTLPQIMIDGVNIGGFAELKKKFEPTWN